MTRNKVVGICPHCGCEVLEKQKGWFCSNKECRFVLWKDNSYFDRIGKRITLSTVEQLLLNRKVSLKNCKSHKTGKYFDADVVLTTEPDGKASFSLEFPSDKKYDKRKKQ